jgi:hypothetical protein
MKTADAYSDTLLRVRAEPTVGYRVAWNWSKAAVIGLFLLVGLMLFARVTLVGP